jgi:VacB/RNase II family 3'-5' exoribonuclease
LTFDLVAAARREMIDRGFEPDMPEAAAEQARDLTPHRENGIPDLTGLLWSSIDNDESRDLDQIEWAERTGTGTRVRVGIADVDALVERDSPIDRHARIETTTVYTGVRTFPMLPDRLSTGLTSLNEGEVRPAIIIEMIVQPDGAIGDTRVYRALVRNRAQLTYSGVGPWLEDAAPPPPKVAASPELQQQLRLQNEAAHSLRDARGRLGALTFDRQEARPILENGHVKGIEARRANRASRLIEDFMIAANEVMARTLRAGGVTAIRRVVKAPERWDRIVELARQYGVQLSREPDTAALNAFLVGRKRADPDRYADVSLAVLKLMGPGEYVAARPRDEQDGHFGLAANDYTHSTAPNRRFADLVTQRLLKALAVDAPRPYADSELAAIARECTLKEDAARKVQRDMAKRIAAVAVQDRIGEEFDALVTGVTRKGVFVRVSDPPLEGRLMRGEEGLDVGDRVHVKLIHADPNQGFIDFSR